MKGKSITPEPHIEKRDKKPYNKPQVLVYGNIREITKNVGMTGAADGSSNPSNNKTSP